MFNLDQLTVADADCASSLNKKASQAGKGANHTPEETDANALMRPVAAPEYRAAARRLDWDRGLGEVGAG